jgi:hexosaminidase
VAQSSLKPDSIVQHYQKEAMALQGVKKGAKLIMSPDKRAYLDIKYDSTTKLGLDYCGHTEVDKAYNWKPAAWLPGIGKENILGVEAPLWSETVTTMDEVEYMAFPRLPGYAEIGWSAPATPDWEEYKTRLGRHGARFKALGIDYYPSKLVPW